MVTLPTSEPAAAGWQLADFLSINAYTQQADAGGQCVLDAGQLEPDELWLIDHMVTQCTSSSTTTLRLYEGSVHPLRTLDGTASGNFNVADWPTGLQVRPSMSLIAVWLGASPGAIGYLSVQGRIMRKV